MIKQFAAIIGLLLCFSVSFFSLKSYNTKKCDVDITLIIHTLSSKHIKIDLDKTRNYDRNLLYANLRSFILNRVLSNIDFNGNSIAQITNQLDNDYYFEFEILKQSDLYPISYI